MQPEKTLPDIAKSQTDCAQYALQWVGMEDIAVPINLTLSNQQRLAISAKSDLFVSLDDKAEKGIHMSRLHHIINQLKQQECDKAELDDLLTQMMQSQGGISNSAKLNLSFDLLLEKKALLSEESGYQTYPVKINSQLKDGQFNYQLELTIPYSSTCPCSAALSRQLLADAADKAFSGEQIDKADLLKWLSNKSVATPHSQRSYAYLKMDLGIKAWPKLDSIVQQFVETISTSVQTMVKRIDEQEFARLNGENLMFCEDAARKLKTV